MARNVNVCFDILYVASFTSNVRNLSRGGEIITITF